MYYSLITALLCLISSSSQAYDPFTAFQVGSSALKAVGSIFGGVDELTSGAAAINDLYSEIDSSTPVNESGQKLISEVEKINQLYSEIGYSGDELGSSANDLKSAKSFEEKVRGITKAIKSAKKVASVFGGLEKRAQSANVESANLEREILNVQLQSLNEQKLAGLRDLRSELEELARKKRFVRDINAELQSKGAKQVGASGLLHFPEASLMIEDGIKVAVQVRPYLLGLILFVLFLRVGLNQFSFRAPEAYGDVIRDSVVCILILALFPELIRASFSIPYSIANQIHASDTPFYSRGDMLKDISKLNVPGASDDSAFKSGVLLAIQAWWAGLRYFMYELAEVLYKYILLVMVALTPFVIFLSEMFNFPVGWKLYFLTFISINLWPILWNVFGILVESSISHGSGLSQLFETSTVMVLQFVSPLLIYFFAKTMSGGTLGHGNHAARVLSSAGSSLGQGLSGGVRVVSSQIQAGGNITNTLLSSPLSTFMRKVPKPSKATSVNAGGELNGL